MTIDHSYYRHFTSKLDEISVHVNVFGILVNVGEMVSVCFIHFSLHICFLVAQFFSDKVATHVKLKNNPPIQTRPYGNYFQLNVT